MNTVKNLALAAIPLLVALYAIKAIEKKSLKIWA